MAQELTCRKPGAKRLWTLEAYRGLTEDLVGRFGPKPLMCANFNAIDINPADIIGELLETLEEIAGEEGTTLWLRGVLGVLITVWGYLKQIRGARMYRLVLRRFIIISLLVEALHLIIEQLIEFLEVLILNIDVLQELRDTLNCEGETDV